MAQQILGTLDLRSSTERAGISNKELRRRENIQAITTILQTLGQAEKVRRDRQTIERVTRAIQQGATKPEAIMAAAQGDPQFSTGGRGIL